MYVYVQLISFLSSTYVFLLNRSRKNKSYLHSFLAAKFDFVFYINNLSGANKTKKTR